jgi:GNAT superfamily N-acetyltransferase
MTQFVIREARPGDESGMHEAHMRSIREVCVRDHGDEEVKGWGNRPLGERWQKQVREGGSWVVEFGGQIVGVAYIRVAKAEPEVHAHIEAPYLAPEAIGKGIGRTLLEIMLDFARNAGAKELTLESTLTAHGFYKSFGFVDTGPLRLKEVGGSQVRSYAMRLAL